MQPDDVLAEIIHDATQLSRRDGILASSPFTLVDDDHIGKKNVTLIARVFCYMWGLSCDLSYQCLAMRSVASNPSYANISWQP